MAERFRCSDAVRRTPRGERRTGVARTRRLPLAPRSWPIPARRRRTGLHRGRQRSVVHCSAGTGCPPTRNSVPSVSAGAPPRRLAAASGARLHPRLGRRPHRDRRTSTTPATRLGLLVWQEFSQSSSGNHSAPSDRPRVSSRCWPPRRRPSCRRLAHHPSLFVWGGGNESTRTASRSTRPLTGAGCASRDGRTCSTPAAHGCPPRRPAPNSTTG